MYTWKCTSFRIQQYIQILFICSSLFSCKSAQFRFYLPNVNSVVKSKRTRTLVVYASSDFPFWQHTHTLSRSLSLCVCVSGFFSFIHFLMVFFSSVSSISSKRVHSLITWLQIHMEKERKIHTTQHNTTQNYVYH